MDDAKIKKILMNRLKEETQNARAQGQPMKYALGYKEAIADIYFDLFEQQIPANKK
jgi:hypothetical protein